MRLLKQQLTIIFLVISTVPSPAQGYLAPALTELRTFDDNDKVMGKVELLYVHEDIQKEDNVGNHTTSLDASIFFFEKGKVGDSLKIDRDRFFTYEHHYQLNGKRYIDVIVKYDNQTEMDSHDDLTVAKIAFEVDRKLSEKVRENGKGLHPLQIYECDTTANGAIPCDSVRVMKPTSELKKDGQAP